MWFDFVINPNIRVLLSTYIAMYVSHTDIHTLQFAMYVSHTDTHIAMYVSHTNTHIAMYVSHTATHSIHIYIYIYDSYHRIPMHLVATSHTDRHTAALQLSIREICVSDKCLQMVLKYIQLFKNIFMLDLIFYGIKIDV